MRRNPKMAAILLSGVMLMTPLASMPMTVMADNNQETATETTTANTTDGAVTVPDDKGSISYANVTVTAAFVSDTTATTNKEDEITLTGLPSGFTNAKATVYYVDTDNKAYIVGEDLDITDNTVKLGKFIDHSKAYRVIAQSGNVAFISQPTATVKFSDVGYLNSYFYAPVYWATAGEKPITTGTSATTFSPKSDCTREDFVTFLWRYAKSPEPTSKQIPFTDVKDTNRYSYKAILWAYENGYITGESSTIFGSKDTITRGQAMAILYRYKGSPDNVKTSGFQDIANKYYTKAVNWGYTNDITDGTSDTTFSPNDNCLRGQIVTFLYNLDKLPKADK